MNELTMAFAPPDSGPGFEPLLLDHFNLVLSYIQRLVGDIGQAHRLTEATFAEVARYYRKGRTPNQPRALLFLLATARAREYLKKGHKRSLKDRLMGKQEIPVVGFTEDDVSGLASDTSQRALSTLELDQRVVLLLHDYCGLSYEEVGKAAGAAKGAVARDLDAARHAFKQAYDYIKF
jgi:DNA-directed RNA polymerase specialized sigma24 family protein